MVGRFQVTMQSPSLLHGSSNRVHRPTVTGLYPHGVGVGGKRSIVGRFPCPPAPWHYLEVVQWSYQRVRSITGIHETIVSLGLLVWYSLVLSMEDCSEWCKVTSLPSLLLLQRTHRCTHTRARARTHTPERTHTHMHTLSHTHLFLCLHKHTHIG